MLFRKRTAIFLIVFIGLLTYWPVALNDFILGDDEDQIISHAQVHSVSNIPRFFLGSTYYSRERDASFGLFYRPLMLSSYALLHSAFGPNPAIFHIFQLFLHISNAIIVFLLISSFFPAVLSFLFALIFLVHPVNSETVVHSSNLQDVLFFFFGSLALFLLTKNKNKKLSGKEIIIFSFCLLLSAFSKETGLLFGFISIIYSFLFSKENVRKILISTASVTITLFVLRFVIAKIGFNMPIFSPIAHADIFTRLVNMPSIFMQYLKTFIFPLYLPTALFGIERGISLFGFFIPLAFSLIFIVIVIIAGVLISKKKRKFLSTYLFFVLWFVLGMGAHSQIIPLEVTVALRWFYFPIIGLLGMITTVYYAFFFHSSLLRKANLIICLIIIILLAIRTYARTGDWRDSKTLFLKELGTSKGNYILENNLATLYIRNEEYEKAWSLAEDSVRQYQYFGNLNNLAVLLTYQKKFPEAEKYFQKALQGPTGYMAYQNYAYFLLYFKKDYKEAINITNMGIEIYPKAGMLYLIKAQSEYHAGNYDEALSNAKTAYALAPSGLTEEVYQAINARREIRLEKFYKLY